MTINTHETYEQPAGQPDLGGTYVQPTFAGREIEEASDYFKKDPQERTPEMLARHAKKLADYLIQRDGEVVQGGGRSLQTSVYSLAPFGTRGVVQELAIKRSGDGPDASYTISTSSYATSKAGGPMLGSTTRDMTLGIGGAQVDLSQPYTLEKTITTSEVTGGLKGKEHLMFGPLARARQWLTADPMQASKKLGPENEERQPEAEAIVRAMLVACHPEVMGADRKVFLNKKAIGSVVGGVSVELAGRQVALGSDSDPIETDMR